MTRRMLVDATHPEEIRVAIIQDNRLIDLDIETANKEQIKGNIYLGRVSRVEPSLQAAFIEFHGGRQGFLSVNDVHPKYFTPGGVISRDIPVAPAGRNVASDPTREFEGDDGAEIDDDEVADTSPLDAAATSAIEEPFPDETDQPPILDVSVAESDSSATEETTDPEDSMPPELVSQEDGPSDAEEEEDRPPQEEIRRQFRRRPPPIQKILQRNQTLLVQVVKEARGNKGATLTTNLSLAGRYTVLLPENPGGGGISRKITDVAERKNLKAILNNLAIPTEMSLIIRTAGMGRNKREFSRDISYLTRLWKMILEGASTKKAPCLIHEEGDLIIRTIRDLYTTDMEEILIEGQEGYRLGKDFMRLLMPRYVKVVQPYREGVPIFARYQVESQIETMHERVVQLKAGSYLVIDTTEALVTIDINSGRSTREKDVESTAFKTNLQAVDEIARQLRLRDLGGLVVIDFIDMEDRKHIQEVEKRLKDAFKYDRAKVQIGRISQFGLLELSRQRLRPTFNESNRIECPRCKGLGTIRSVESAAIYTYRCIEEEVAQGRYQTLNYHVSQEVMNYLFNHKRASLVRLEDVNQVTINIHADMTLQPPTFTTSHVDRTKKERQEKAQEERKATPPPAVETEPGAAMTEAAGENSGKPTVPETGPVAAGTEQGEPGKKKRRRKRRRKKHQQGVTVGPMPATPEAEPRSEPAGEWEEATEVASEPEAPGAGIASPPTQQDIRQLEALAMRFPGLYTLHEVGSGAHAVVGTALEGEEEEDTDPQPQDPNAHDPSLGHAGRGEGAPKRKRSRRGGRGKGKKKTNLGFRDQDQRSGFASPNDTQPPFDSDSSPPDSSESS
ncbi:MAG: Rne/Rng family ribonuclease [Magnetococcales bacterium]|nr:Rne/Rng family ribonuclease [Magnetococcales bacterium]